MKILIIGYGSIGKRHIKNILRIGNHEIFLYTKQQLKIKKNITIFHSLNEAIEKKPDIALITNPTSLHLKTALKLSRNGCNIFIEKPISDSINDVDLLLQLIKKKKLITQIGYNMRFHPCLVKIKKLLDNEKIGKILSVKAENGSFLPNWHPNEDYAKNYASKKELGGGVVLTCSHEIDYMYWLFGKVSEVFSVTGKFSDLNIDVEDLSSIILKFKNNIIAEIHLDYFQRPNSRNLKIIGTKGTLYCDFISNSIKFYNVKNNKWSSILKEKNFNKNSIYLEEMNYFLNCVNKRKKSKIDVKEGIETLKIALAILRSSKTKKVIKLK